MSERYELVLTRTARRVLSDALPFKVASAVWELIDGDLRSAPRRVGKQLNAPYEGDWVARRATYRIRYAIDEDKHAVIVLDIRGRADAYHYSGGR